MVQAPPKNITLGEFIKLPETNPASEYIDGKIIQMPQGKHSAILGELVPAINSIVKPKRIARAFPELRCTFGGRSIIPDIVIFIWSQIPRDENEEIANTFTVAPDWTIEILSPDQSQTKVTKNILHCLKHGTQIGWLIYPNEQTKKLRYLNSKMKLFLYHHLPVSYILQSKIWLVAGLTIGNEFSSKNPSGMGFVTGMMGPYMGHDITQRRRRHRER